MYLYYLRDYSRNVIKFGVTKNPEKRRKNIISGFGLLESEIYFEAYFEAANLEKPIFNLLQEEKRSGEWFNLSGIAEEFYDYIKLKEKLSINDINYFTENYYNKLYQNNTVEIEKILKNINSKYSPIIYERDKYGISFKASIHDISNVILNELKNSEEDLTYLFSDSLQFYYKGRQRCWTFLEEEINLVRTLLTNLNIRYKDLN